MQCSDCLAKGEPARLTFMSLRSSRANWVVIIVGAMVAVSAVWAAPRVESGPQEPAKQQGARLPCAEIVEQVDRIRRRAPNREVEIVDVGRVMNQDLRWVERCMKLYGRRPLKPAPVHEEQREEEEEAWESGEGEELGHEETGDAREEEKPEHERQRILKVMPDPTPLPLPDDNDF